MRQILILAAFLVLSACATPEATPGPAPDLKPALLAHRAELFKDPDSIRDAAIGHESRFLNMAWQVCIRLNAKNSFGGYTGLQEHVITIYDNGAPPIIQEPTIVSGCGAGYEPFPEMNGNYQPAPNIDPGTKPKKPKK